MPKLGIVTCQILELELAHILSNDPDISEIEIVDDSFSKELFRILKGGELKQVRRASNIEKLETDETTDISVLVRVMQVGLHSNIPKLRREVAAAVKGFSPYVSAVLLGYGLCGNALDNTSVLFSDIRVPVVLPRQNGKPVDDCVSLIIGGTENYYEEQCRCAGTMFMNAGFSRHWREILSLDLPPNLIQKKDKILDRMWGNYERSLLLTTSVLGEKELRENTKDFNDRFSLRTEVRTGTLSILENAWKEVKKAAI